MLLAIAIKYLCLYQLIRTQQLLSAAIMRVVPGILEQRLYLNKGVVLANNDRGG